MTLIKADLADKICTEHDFNREQALQIVEIF